MTLLAAAEMSTNVRVDIDRRYRMRASLLTRLFGLLGSARADEFALPPLRPDRMFTMRCQRAR